MSSSEKEEILASSGEGVVTDVETNKCCSDCKTTKTPLWRSGPSGPKSLCNACGIRYRKNERNPALATTGGIARTCKNDPKKGKIGKRKNVKLRNGLKVNLMGLQQRSKRQWGEVERAALLLMALSCGAVFA